MQKRSVSKIHLHLNQCKNDNYMDFVWPRVSLINYASYVNQIYWLCDRCDRAFTLKNISCRHQSVVMWVNSLLFIGASVQQRIKYQRNNRLRM